MPLDATGKWLYPFISWHCPRTAPQQEWWIEAYQGLNRLTLSEFRRLVAGSGMTMESLTVNRSPLGRLPPELKDRLLTFYLETADVVPWQADRRE